MAMAARARKIWTGVAATVVVVAGTLVVYRVARAAPPRRFPADPEEDLVPLRPPPLPADAAPTGPLATRLRELIADLDDDELGAVRISMPPGWWADIHVATQVPDDGNFALELQPLRRDMESWSRDQVSTLEDDLVSAMGLLNAMELRSILQEAGIL